MEHIVMDTMYIMSDLNTGWNSYDYIAVVSATAFCLSSLFIIYKLRKTW